MYHPHLAGLVTFQYLAFPVTGLPPTPVIIFPWGITQPTGRWTLGHGTGNFTLVEIDVTEEANSLIF